MTTTPITSHSPTPEGRAPGEGLREALTDIVTRAFREHDAPYKSAVDDPDSYVSRLRDKIIAALASPASAPSTGIGGGDALREALIGWYGETEDMNRLLDGDLPDSAPVYVVGARRSRYQMGTYGDLRRAALAQPQPVTEPSSGGEREADTETPPARISRIQWQMQEHGGVDSDDMEWMAGIVEATLAAPIQPPRDGGAREALAEGIMGLLRRTAEQAPEERPSSLFPDEARQILAALSAPESVGPGEMLNGDPDVLAAFAAAEKLPPLPLATDPVEAVTALAAAARTARTDDEGNAFVLQHIVRVVNSFRAVTPAPALPTTGEETGDEWRPIKTAPRDDTLVLLGFYDGMPAPDARWIAIAGWYEAGPADRCWYDVLETRISPTHWMPLRTPPAPSPHPAETPAPVEGGR